MVCLWCGRTVGRSVGVRSRDYQFSRMGSLPHFFAHGAPLRALRARELRYYDSHLATACIYTWIGAEPSSHVFNPDKQVYHSRISAVTFETLLVNTLCSFFRTSTGHPIVCFPEKVNELT